MHVIEQVQMPMEITNGNECSHWRLLTIIFFEGIKNKKQNLGVQTGGSCRKVKKTGGEGGGKKNKTKREVKMHFISELIYNDKLLLLEPK